MAPPIPADLNPVLEAPAQKPTTAAPDAADLWSDDRSRIDTPLLSADLEAEVQWAIFEQCEYGSSLFCAVMAIASVESDFDSQTVGDGGDSHGMMQINTRWHKERMAALGVTDLEDPVQCAAVAIDYLLELIAYTEAGPDDHILYIAYNAGPANAERAAQSGTVSTAYSEAVIETYRAYMAEMEGSGWC